jgi:ATP-binding cassette subfamily B protein
MDIYSAIIALTAFGFGAFAYFNGMLLLGEMVAVIQAVLFVVPSVVRTSMANFHIQEAKASLERINEFIDQEPEYNIKKEEGLEIDRFDTLNISNLSFSFPGRLNTFEDITFNLNKGDIIALHGKSGSGKTTILKILQRFYSPTTGELTVNGVEWEEISTKSWRELIAVVPQEVKIFNGSVLGNITLDETSGLATVTDFCKKTGLNKFFEQLPNGYATIIGEMGINLSGGQKQLVGVARALYKNPQVLLLDEATASMDKDTESEIFDIIEHIRIEDEMSVVLVSHDNSLVQKAQRIYTVDI